MKRAWWRMMLEMNRAFGLFVLALAACAGVQAQRTGDPGSRREAVKQTEADASHSAMGPAFNHGPRFPGRLLEGLGPVDFKITTRSPIAQRYFNQGLAYLYSFDWVEAERAFRTGLTYDADAAMLYWGLSLTDSGRAKEFLAMAVERAGTASDRESRYIRAFDRLLNGTGDRRERVDANCGEFREIIRDYPNDVDAKAFLVWQLIGVDRRGERHYGEIERLFEEIFAQNPDHPGAHHYRIHMYDERSDAKKALVNADRYLAGTLNIGHAQHMPGHIYASTGQWSKAVAAQDRATRVERKTFRDMPRLPFESWNFTHNQDYLISNLGYLGRVAEGIRLAEELIAMPRDPSLNNGSGFSMAGTGSMNLLRMMLRGEMWETLIDEYAKESSRMPSNAMWKSFALGSAHLGLGNVATAKDQLAVLQEKGGNGTLAANLIDDLSGRIMLAEGLKDEGFAKLERAVKQERERFLWGDPPSYLRPSYEALGEAYLTDGKPSLAEALMRKSLESQPENAFALAILVRSLLAQGNADEAARLNATLQALDPFDAPIRPFVRLRDAWRQAGRNLWAEASLKVPGPGLDAFGPNVWVPNAAPKISLVTHDGKRVGLDDARGKFVVLVFYLGGMCSHCMSQIEGLGKVKQALASRGALVLAASPDKPEALAKWVEDPRYPIALHHDPDSAAAKAFHAYDEFEDKPLHATILLDKDGRVWWYDIGSEPFMNFEFLIREMDRLNTTNSPG